MLVCGATCEVNFINITQYYKLQFAKTFNIQHTTQSVLRQTIQMRHIQYCVFRLDPQQKIIQLWRSNLAKTCVVWHVYIFMNIGRWMKELNITSCVHCPLHWNVCYVLDNVGYRQVITAPCFIANHAYCQSCHGNTVPYKFKALQHSIMKVFRFSWPDVRWILIC